MYYKWQYTDKSHKFERKMISDFNFYSCGIQKCQPNYTYGPISRDYYFIHFITEGEGTFTINGKSFPLKAGQGFISPARDVITYKAAFHEPWTYAWIGFLGTQADQYIQLLCGKNDPVFSLSGEHIQYFHKRIKEIVSERSNDLSKYLKGNGILNDLVGILLESKDVKELKLLDTSVAFQARRYIDLHYHDGIQINVLAAELGVHPNYLSTIFKKQYQMSPKRFLRKVQIDKAKELLSTTDYPISVIATSVGYPEPLAFSKVFKKETGVSPSDFRKNLTET